MKHLLLFSLAAFILSCQAPSPKSNQFDKFNENAASADSTFNLFESGDLDIMSDMYADDMFWSPANTTDSLSKEQWRSGMQEWHASFDSFSFQDRLYYPSVDEEFVPNGGVRVYGTWSSVHKETGKSTQTKYYAVLEYNEDGKIEGNMEWFDLGGIFDQLEESTEATEE
ncbi:MAG: hypothetical protein QNK64_08080 [Saprospiraceae bacterium]